MIAQRLEEAEETVEHGNVYHMLLKRSDTETLEVAKVKLKPGARTPRSSHPDEEEVYFFLSGSALLTVDGDEKRVTAGMYAYVPRNAVHEIANDTDSPFEYIYVANFPDEGKR